MADIDLKGVLIKDKKIGKVIGFQNNTVKLLFEDNIESDWINAKEVKFLRASDVFDDNKQELYEGDIVDFRIFSAFILHTIIRFSNGIFWCEYEFGGFGKIQKPLRYLKLNSRYKITKVGNIYTDDINKMKKTKNKYIYDGYFAQNEEA